jgi:hypothetical protein
VSEKLVGRPDFFSKSQGFVGQLPGMSVPYSHVGRRPVLAKIIAPLSHGGEPPGRAPTPTKHGGSLAGKVSSSASSR